METTDGMGEVDGQETREQREERKGKTAVKGRINGQEGDGNKKGKRVSEGSQ